MQRKAKMYLMRYVDIQFTIELARIRFLPQFSFDFKQRRGKVSVPSSGRVHPHPCCVNPLFPFFLLQRLSSTSGKLARGFSERQRLLKALPLATDKTAEDPPDLLLKKLARNFSRSAQLLNELIKNDRYYQKSLKIYQNGFPF